MMYLSLCHGHMVYVMWYVYSCNSATIETHMPRCVLFFFLSISLIIIIRMDMKCYYSATWGSSQTIDETVFLFFEILLNLHMQSKHRKQNWKIVMIFRILKLCIADINCEKRLNVPSNDDGPLEHTYRFDTHTHIKYTIMRIQIIIAYKMISIISYSLFNFSSIVWLRPICLYVIVQTLFSSNSVIKF